MANPSPEHWMRRAIALSRRGLPAPNPHVGCVLVQNGRVVGEGYHRYAGGLHAEAAALLQAGPQAMGAEAFVTLEPCNHQGRQPPCVAALERAAVKKVWIAVSDPNPRVSGGGASALRRLGIDVEEGLLAEEAREANRAWLRAMELRRPYVTAKAAMSLDGRIALPDGRSHWITGAAARSQARRLRAEMGAVLAGAGTVRIDRPALTARIRGLPHEPVRVILDPKRSLPDSQPVFSEGGRSIRVVAPSAARDGDLSIPCDERGFDLARLLECLWQEGMTGLLVEGGAKTLSRFLESGWVDRLDLFVGNAVLGAGPSWSGVAEGPKLGLHPRWRLKHTRRLGEDLWLRYERPA